jgi:hypothetical protein
VLAAQQKPSSAGKTSRAIGRHTQGWLLSVAGIDYQGAVHQSLNTHKC